MPAIPGLRRCPAKIGHLDYLGRMPDKIRLDTDGLLPADCRANLGVGRDPVATRAWLS